MVLKTGNTKHFFCLHRPQVRNTGTDKIHIALRWGSGVITNLPTCQWPSKETKVVLCVTNTSDEVTSKNMYCWAGLLSFVSYSLYFWKNASSQEYQNYSIKTFDPKLGFSVHHACSIPLMSRGLSFSTETTNYASNQIFSPKTYISPSDMASIT